MKHLLFISAAVVSLLCGCASTPDTVAYKTLATTQLTVEQGLGFWNSFIVAKRNSGTPVSVDTELRVKAAYERYQKAALVMVDAGKAWTDARSSTNSASAASLYDLAVTAAQNSKSDLFNLLSSLGVNLTP